MPPVKINVPLNRVEGDLEIKVEIEDGVVKDAWSSGTMYRGFENMLVGRGALDGLVLTPRICGICTTTHLYAAVKALDMVVAATLPDDAVRVRNLALMAEHVQSDVRHAFLIFAPDFVNPAHKGHSLYEEAVRRYEPFKGSVAVETIKETKKLLEMVAILGGQWPHSSFMVPGGVVSLPSKTDLLLCSSMVSAYRKWYETRVLGCAIERWLSVDSAFGLDAWLDESPAHKNSEVGFFIRYAIEAGLDKVGGGHGNFISYGSLDLPSHTSVAGVDGKLVPSGFYAGGKLGGFDQRNVTEDVAHSWFVDAPAPRHPSAGETRPYASGGEGGKYSWIKAPRHDGQPAETGPLAEAMVSGDPLITDLVKGRGPSVMTRQLARLVRGARIIPVMEAWLRESMQNGGVCYIPPGEVTDGAGHGLIQAARGALGHWVTVKDGRIVRYQIITPTAWHASPRDTDGVRGPFEEALVGASVQDPENPVELGHIVRSFDACLVCAVHAVDARGRKIGGLSL